MTLSSSAARFRDRDTAFVDHPRAVGRSVGARGHAAVAPGGDTARRLIGGVAEGHDRTLAGVLVGGRLVVERDGRADTGRSAIARATLEIAAATDVRCRSASCWDW